MTTPSTTPSFLAGVLLRMAIPCAILAAGWFGFQRLAGEVERPPLPEPKEVLLRSRIEEIAIVDYPVVVKTHAVVQAHNRITLTSQVSGTVAKTSPFFEVGAYFKKGDVLVEIDQRDYQTALAIAESELAAAKSELKLAVIVEKRKLKLVESNAVPQGEVETASASREQAQANVALAETNVEQAKLNLQRTKFVAPFDGRVISKLIGIGQLAGQNAPLGEIFAIDYVEVRLPVSGEQRDYLDLPEFPDDSPLAVRLQDGIQQSNDSIWEGTIVRTEGVLDADSRDLFAIARIDDPFGRESGKPPLRIGQPVIASIDGKVLHDVIALPRGAVRELDQVVLVDRADQTLLPLQVKTLWSDAEKVIVSSAAIPPGMWLATTPMPFTPKGAKIEIIPPADAAITIADSTSTKSDENATN
ncbi:efflux RND transporter periplasmic adaptor subunit [Allorhodopirellula solitaria]|uniref:Toluene efflux pump periplasmic linker protein TtgD n=1 Tax=Allorhodopirellula solitaria TaxID=2527987 RepID=A0A5C5XSA1_9BACT|nr:efflux RND transporter periplasmic adaptor subunit [Allorhodopirellula solitaria]TWT65253.1 Toluene efflux pump periplasmic linker protein TtgD precursor [Allorhodopirellula solitaria]